MDDKLAQIESHYERVVDYFINQYKFKANLISYQDYLVGCSLFNIGISHGLEQSVIKLANFLQDVNVQTKNNQEVENVIEIKKQISVEIELQKQSRQ